MRRIRDFFYSFSDVLFATIVVAGILYVLFININYITHIEAKSVENQEVQVETVQEKVKVNVTIPNNINLEQLASILKEFEIVNDAEDFVKSFDNKEVKIKSGEFELEKNMDYDSIKSNIIE